MERSGATRGGWNTVTPPLPSSDGPPVIDSPPAVGKPVTRWRWWIHLILIGAYPVIIAAISWQRAPDRGPALSQSVSGLLATCGIELIQFSIVFGLGWFASRASRDDLLLRWR